MKRYDLELTATGPVMEERKEGAFVPFSEVDLLKHHINQYQEERSSTGMAISNAILSGILAGDDLHNNHIVIKQCVMSHISSNSHFQIQP